MMIKTGIEHTFLRVKVRLLLEHAHSEILAVDDFARILAFLTGQHREEC